MSTSRSRIPFLILFVALIVATLSATPALASDQYMVLFKRSIAPGAATKLIEKAGGEVVRGYFKAGIVVAKSSDPNFDTILEQDERVKDCGRDAVIQAKAPQILGGKAFPASSFNMKGLEKISLQAEAAVGGGGGVEDPTKAALYEFQWNMRLIQADEAWALGYLGDPDITVAVLDSGLDYTLPDLAGKVDLDRSVSFVPSDDILVQDNFPGAHPIADLHIHGTFVANLIACNSLVLACVAPNASLFGVKVVSGTLEGTAASITSGLLYAEENGADVIALSIDMFMSQSADAVAIEAIRQAIDFVSRKGVFVVGEIGGDDPGIDLDNNDPDEIQVPGELTDRLLALSASGPLDEFSDFSNFGVTAVDMTAPGGFAREPIIDNGVLGPCSSFTLIPTLPECGKELSFVFLVGPFISVAHVSGTALLMDERGTDGLRPWRMKNQLLRSAEDIGDPGFDAFFGEGRLNTLRALTLGSETSDDE